MAEFCVYKYEFVEVVPPMFRENDNKFSPELSRKVLGAALRGVIDLLKKKRKDLVRTPAHVVANHDDVALLTVHNIISQKIWKEMADKPEEMDSLPHSRVIVDNRKGVQQLVVEKSSAFGGKPDEPMRMLQRYMNILLQDYCAGVEIVGKFHEGDLWDRVESEEKHGHRVCKVEFILGSKEQADTMGISGSNLLFATSQWNSTVNAARSRFITEARKGQYLNFAKAEEDCAHTVELCARNGYEMKVHFENSSLYRSTKKNQIAFFPMNDMHYADFKSCSPELDLQYSLVKWLDEIRIDDPESFKYVKYETQQD